MTEYDHKSIEQKWQKYWEDNKTFKTPLLPSKKKFYCLDMFPYPSGTGLHVGHPLGYTATDIVSRYKRMLGFDVLHPMGFDAFGLPAEQHAVQTGEHPSLITKQNCETFTRQLKVVGLSFDWDRNLATCDADYYRWTQWIFLKLYNAWFDEKLQKARPISELPIPTEISAKGEVAIQSYQADYRLAYYSDAMVNWCPALGTVLANEEVIDGKSERGGFDVVRKPMKQWMFRITKYADRLVSELEEIEWPENIKEQQRNWIGRKTGAEIQFMIEGTDAALTAFTTRPDTLFGVTFFVISPEHPLAQVITTDDQRARVAKYCDEALKMSEFTRTLDSRQKTGVFTGAYVVNPATKGRVPVYVADYVLMSYGTGAVMGVPAHDDRDFEFARLFHLDIKPVLAPVSDDKKLISAITEGEVSWTKPGLMLPDESPIAKEIGLAGIPNVDAGAKITEWLARRGLGKQTVNYKLRDWLFSRQRYWGEPIPIIHWEDGTVTPLDPSELPLVLPEVLDYKPGDGGESPLSKATDWLYVTDPKSGKKGRRETNTMPQWAGSCWYYLRFIDPTNSKAGWDKNAEKAWMSVDLYVGGAEHAVLHLLYARFWHKVLFDLGEVSTREPFYRLYNQGMVQAFAFKDSRGALVPTDHVKELADGTATKIDTGEKLEKIIAKMSKSLRNVVTLDSIVDEYGADVYRMYLMFMGPLDSSRIWDPKAITGNLRFLKRAWTFVTDNIGAKASDTPKSTKAINKLIKRVTLDLDKLEFNTAVSSMMEFLNEVFGTKVSQETMKRFVLVLSPFAPHVAEELWEKLGNNKTLAFEAWPTWDESALKEDTCTVVIQVQGKKRATIDVPLEISEGDLKKAVLEKMHGTDYNVSESNKFITVFQAGTKIPKLVNVV